MSHKHDIPNSRNHKYAIHSSSSTTKSQTHENAEMQITKSVPKITVPQLQYPISQIHALNVGHDCLTSMTYQILKYADSQIRSPRFTDLQISLPRIMYLRIPSHRFTTSRISQKSWLSLKHDAANSSCTIHLAQGQKPPKIFAKGQPPQSRMVQRQAS